MLTGRFAALVAMSFVDLQIGYAAGRDGHVITTRDGGTTWATLSVADGILLVADLEFRDPNHGVLLEGMHVRVTENGGRPCCSFRLVLHKHSRRILAPAGFFYPHSYSASPAVGSALALAPGAR